jgi:hypothetical protein
MPYERARSRVLRAESHLLRGDRHVFAAELEAACAAFERLGARPDERRARERLAVVV